jgi:hypothetical protein
VHADAGLDRVDDDEADDERDGRDDLKVEKSSMPAMPVTTVQKITGAMIILMRRMKPSPKGFI